MKQRLQVHAVPTDKANEYFKQGQLMLVTSDVVANKGEWQICGKDNKFTNNNSGFTAHHLYFTSDEDVKGDWYIRTGIGTNTRLFKANELPLNYKDARVSAHKVVATTNPDLWYDFSGFSGGGNPRPTGIAKIPQSFIQYFAEKQGVWGVDVEIEAGDCLHPNECGKIICECPPKFKLNSQGEVTWHPVEQKMYTRAELIQACYNYAAWLTGGPPKREGLNNSKEWFNKKYPE